MSTNQASNHFGAQKDGTRWLEARIWAQMPESITAEELRQQADLLKEIIRTSEAKLRRDPNGVAILAALDTYRVATMSYAKSLETSPGSDAHVAREKEAYERAVELRAIRIECEAKGKA